MTLTNSFQKDHYIYKSVSVTAGDQQRLAFLNDIAAMVPVDEKEEVSLMVLAGKANAVGKIEERSEFPAKTIAAFDALVAKVDDMTHRDAHNQVKASGTVQDDLYNAIRDFNHAIHSQETPLTQTLEGHKHLTQCRASRVQHAEIASSGLADSTYKVIYR